MKSAGPDQGGLLRAEAVSKMIGASKQTIYLMAREQRLASVRWGRSVRFQKKDIEQFILRHRRGVEKGA